MKAALLQDFKKPLAITEVERPAPGPNEVLIAMEACGVCHSDLHVADGDWKQFAGIVKKPLILGHEVVGRVAERGARVREVEIEERVGVPWVHWTCGECECCRAGNENLCCNQKITGVTVDGGYAEYLKAPASHVVRIPEGISSAEAAPLLCAGVTVYRALRKGRLAAGQRLAIFGAGGLGHLAIQLGRDCGATVTAIDVSEEKLVLARRLGAEQTVNARAPDAIQQLRAGGGAHVALVTSASKAAYDMAFYSLRPAGILLAVGLPAENICFPPILMAAGEVRIQASAVGTRQDLREMLAAAAAGKVRCQVATRPLSEANQALDELRKGEVAGRMVLMPG